MQSIVIERRNVSLRNFQIKRNKCLTNTLFWHVKRKFVACVDELGVSIKRRHETDKTINEIVTLQNDNERKINN